VADSREEKAGDKDQMNLILAEAEDLDKEVWLLKNAHIPLAKMDFDKEGIWVENALELWAGFWWCG